MATAAREEKIQEEGLGTVGKFMDERFFRKSPAKPYDRPPTDIRTSGSSSWILKLVDPAQRLISSGSQMLFCSVFRNLPHRLTPCTSSQVASQSSQSRKDDKKADRTDPFEVQVATNVGDNRNRFDRFGMMELEKTLKRKTFTRSEIDHLTTLLHSRTVDLPVVNEEKRFKFISSIPESNRKEEFVKIPTSEVRMGTQSISTPILSSSVLEEDIYSPAEIARAYMDSRRPKLCPSMRSLQAQGLGENSAGPSSTLFSSKSTDMLLVPSSISQGLKRRSSFLDNDFGSTVPLRRIRQKPNILLSKGLSLPVSARPISVPVNGLSFDASQSSKFGKVEHFPSSIRNSQLPLKPKKNFARKFIMKASHSIPGASSSIYTPSRSYKMASKILEQLDKLTPPKEKVSEFNLLLVGEKSPPKLSPSTVGGLPLRSLKDVDLPRSQECVDDDKRSNGLPGIPFHDNQDQTFQNQEKMGNLKPSDPHLRLTALLKDSGSIGSSGDSMNDLGVPASAVVKSYIQSPENKRAFQMWPDKDGIDHDESYADRVAPAMAEVREGDISLSVRQTTTSEALAPAKPQTTSEVFVGSPLNRSYDLKTSDDGTDDEKDTRFTFQNASSLCTTSQQETIDSAPAYSFDNKDLPENKQSDPSICLKNNVTPRKQPNASFPVFDVGSKVASLTESHAASEDGNKAPYTQSNSASSYPYVQESVYLNVDTSSSHKLDRSCRTCNDAFSSSASISAGLAFSFNSSASYRNLNNGQSISCPSLFSSYSPTASMSQSSFRNIFLSATSASKGANITATDNHPSTLNLAPSAPSRSTMGLGTFGDKIKQDMSLYNANDTHFSSISTPANSHYSMFSFSAAATPSSVNNQLSPPTDNSATELSAQEVSAGKKLAATSSTLGSYVSLSSSGLAGKASVSSGISFGYSSPAFELFNPGNRLSEFPIVGFTSVPATSTVGTSNVSTSSAPLGFESSTGAHFSSICPTTSEAALASSSSKPVSCNSHPTVAFRFSSGNSDSEEQDISKDNVPVFSQKPISPPSSGFSFVPATPELLNPFQFGKQQTLAEPQNSSPLIASSSNLEVNAGGGFSLGAGSGDKANRRFLKVKRKK